MAVRLWDWNSVTRRAVYRSILPRKAACWRSRKRIWLYCGGARHCRPDFVVDDGWVYRDISVARRPNAQGLTLVPYCLYDFSLRSHAVASDDVYIPQFLPGLHPQRLPLA